MCRETTSTVAVGGPCKYVLGLRCRNERNERALTQICWVRGADMIYPPSANDCFQWLFSNTGAAAVRRFASDFALNSQATYACEAQRSTALAERATAV